MTPDKSRLSEEEMEALLHRGASPGGNEGDAEALPRRVEKYDFFQPNRFSKSELERLRRMHSHLPQRAGQALSRLLRSNVRMQLRAIEQTKWDYVLEESAEGAVGYVFRMEPVGRRGTVVLENSLARACLGRIMGTGIEKEEGVGFSELEAQVFRRFVAAMLSPLPELWQKIGDFSIEPGRYARDLRLISVFASQEDLFRLSLAFQGSAGEGQIDIFVSFDVLRRMTPRDEEARAGETDRATQTALRRSLQRARLELAVLLGRADVPTEELLRLQRGDVVVLDGSPEEPVEIRVNDRVKARGYPGLSGQRLAVKLAGERPDG